MGHDEAGIDLPFVDEHKIAIDVSRDLVWTALRDYATTSIGLPHGHLLALLLAPVPPSGFEIAETIPGTRLVLTGRHRFSRYTLVFELDTPTPDSGAAPGSDPSPGRTVLRARTYAEFPGVRGRAYRALVIGTGAHVVATTRMLRAVQRRARPAPPS